MNPSRSAAAVDALWALDGAGSQPAGRGDAEPGRRRGAEPRWQRRRADRPGGPWCRGARSMRSRAPQPHPSVVESAPLRELVCTFAPERLAGIHPRLDA